MNIQIGTAYISLTREEIESLLKEKNIRIPMEDTLANAHVIILTMDDEEVK